MWQEFAIRWQGLAITRDAQSLDHQLHPKMKLIDDYTFVSELIEYPEPASYAPYCLALFDCCESTRQSCEAWLSEFSNRDISDLKAPESSHLSHTYEIPFRESILHVDFFIYAGALALWLDTSVVGDERRFEIETIFIADYITAPKARELRLALCQEGRRAPIAPWICEFSDLDLDEEVLAVARSHLSTMRPMTIRVDFLSSFSDKMLETLIPHGQNHFIQANGDKTVGPTEVAEYRRLGLEAKRQFGND